MVEPSNPLNFGSVLVIGIVLLAVTLLNVFSLTQVLVFSNHEWEKGS